MCSTGYKYTQKFKYKYLFFLENITMNTPQNIVSLMALARSSEISVRGTSFCKS